MNTIEMQSITAIAHLRAAILYFMDLSEQCGYPVSAQIALFKSIRPLFANKIVFLAINKIDVAKPEDLSPDLQEQIQSLVKSGEVTDILQLSCNTQEGVQEAKNAACERLIAERVSQKLKAGTSNSGAIGGRLAEVMARIHVAQPMGGATRETFIPDAVKSLKKYDKEDPERRKLARDIEVENGGAGVFNVDLKADYLLENPEWKYDKIPEILDGKNVADYIDPDIEAKLAELEAEEERLENEGYYDEEEEETDEEDRKALEDAKKIREKISLIRNDARLKKRLKNRPIMPRSKTKKTLSEMDEALDVLGVDTSRFLPAMQEQLPRRGRSTTRSRLGTEDAMDVDSNTLQAAKDRIRAMSRARSQPRSNRQDDGVTTETARTRAEKLTRLNQKRMNRMARQGEADRHETASLAKHLVSLNLLFSIFPTFFSFFFFFNFTLLTYIPPYRLPESVASERRTGAKQLPFVLSVSVSRYDPFPLGDTRFIAPHLLPPYPVSLSSSPVTHHMGGSCLTLLFTTANRLGFSKDCKSVRAWRRLAGWFRLVNEKKKNGKNPPQILVNLTKRGLY